MLSKVKNCIQSKNSDNAVSVNSYTINGDVSVSGDITSVETWVFATDDGVVLNKNVALCNGGEEFVFELGNGKTVTKSTVTVKENS